ncbi:cation diffusion facilitator family transporter [Hansschlegelia quercus]|uniref:Cation transporter n=1 Tax=Hansschlegelia quercus TaxID=2528245 RepID=A0A4Q9GJ15_9HYPH|nr:cation diffusion facilitator family transporter [Hansschlegelia quercus]TBN54223.1 cation transporter [Hansschlegelia quercus]
MNVHDHQHGHDHDHDHGHAHGASHGGHGHAHAPADFGRAFAIGVALNTGFVLVEAAYGFVANSTALLADAGHNLSDVLGLLVAWAAATASKRQPSERFTYGLKSSSILAALFNALFLLVAIGAIAFEAIRRFAEPSPVSGGVVMIVAAIGIAVNGATALLFMKGGKSDINVRGAFLHMAADAAVSLGVVVAGLVILYTGWLWLDPAVSLAIAALIFWGTWGLLRDSVTMSLAAAPPNMPMQEVLAFLQGRDGVVEVHDLHVWPMSTTETALTAHLVMPAGHPGDAFLRDVCEALGRQFSIGHATLQVEIEGVECPLAPAHVV